MRSRRVKGIADRRIGSSKAKTATHLEGGAAVFEGAWVTGAWPNPILGVNGSGCVSAFQFTLPLKSNRQTGTFSKVFLFILLMNNSTKEPDMSRFSPNWVTCLASRP